VRNLGTSPVHVTLNPWPTFLSLLPSGELDIGQETEGPGFLELELTDNGLFVHFQWPSRAHLGQAGGSHELRLDGRIPPPQHPAAGLARRRGHRTRGPLCRAGRRLLLHRLPIAAASCSGECRSGSLSRARDG
jgi:hypothetical protein